MDNYKINFSYSAETTINDIFVKVLKKELKKFIKMIYKNNKKDISSTYTYLSLHDKDNNIWRLL